MCVHLCVTYGGCDMMGASCETVCSSNIHVPEKLKVVSDGEGSVHVVRVLVHMQVHSSFPSFPL